MADHTVEVLSRALEAGARAFLAALEEETRAPMPVLDPARTYTAVDYDPLLDQPPLPTNPAGTDAEKAMAHVAYLGAVARINAERKRGANAGEVSRYAKVAGYPDGRAVNGWNSRTGSPRLIENLDGARILNADGHKWLAERAAELNIKLRGNLTPLPVA